MKKKNKGFTLVELLVTIVILGMITALSFPLLKRLKDNNETNRFETYRSSLEELAKSYVDAYEDDLFLQDGSNKCAIISVEMLEQKKIFKDVVIDEYSCNSNGTFIKVTYENDGDILDKRSRKYKYKAYLGCGVAGDNGRVADQDINTVFPEKDEGFYNYLTICNDE